MLTTSQAASRLGITPRRVLALIAAGRLPAQKIGRDWIIQEADLEKIKERPEGWPKGRPRTPPPQGHKDKGDTDMNPTLRAAIDNRDWELIAGLWHSTESTHGLPTIPQLIRQELIEAARADGVDLLSLVKEQ